MQMPENIQNINNHSQKVPAAFLVKKERKKKKTTADLSL